MNSIKVLGKYLDQPIFLKKFSSRVVPTVLLTGGAALIYKHVSRTPEQEKKNELVKSSCVLAGTITSALIAPKLAGKTIHGLDKIVHSLKGKACDIHCKHEHEHEHEHHHEHSIALTSMSEIKKRNSHLVDNFLAKIQVDDSLKNILLKAKETHLNTNDIKNLFGGFDKNADGQKLLSKLIPEPEDIDSNHIFKEDVKRLSVLGLIPVIGGVSGGIIGDKLTDKNWKKKVPNKINEGAYQYLANIFLCNIGAGTALYIMEKAKVKNKLARAAGMVAGIIITGIICGSAIANFLGQKIINPILGNRHRGKEHLYDERKPDALDLGLHVDDVATVAVLSGLKWIEPALPILYAVSGYRAGIGYRNGSHSHH